MKSILKFISLTLALTLLLASCGGTSSTSPSEESSQESSIATEITFLDANDNSVTISSPKRVVSLYGSFAEAWMLSGGTLIGVTEDAKTERKMDLSDDVALIGTVKEPNLEEIIALDPDFVILSADIPTQAELSSSLTQMNIPHGYFRVDTYKDYINMMTIFCESNNRPDLFLENAANVQGQVEASIKKAESFTGERPKVLLLRAFSTGAKAKGSDNLAGVMLEDLLADNIVTRHESLLEDLSIEEIINEDPDFIFVVIMGTDQEAAIKSITDSLGASPAWKDLKAVKNDKMIVLPKNLFHYKPNAAWGESYEFMEKILYPQ